MVKNIINQSPTTEDRTEHRGGDGKQKKKN